MREEREKRAFDQIRPQQLGIYFLSFLEAPLPTFPPNRIIGEGAKGEIKKAGMQTEEPLGIFSLLFYAGQRVSMRIR